MKGMRKYLWLSVVLAGLSSCSVMNHVQIQTYVPAEVTFPEDVKKVLIVNNALPQPDSIGFISIIAGSLQDTSHVRADSALFDACSSLGNTLADANFFDDVLLYHGDLRRDQHFEAEVRLTPVGVDSLCALTGADAVISLDQMLFSLTRNISVFDVGFFQGTISVYTTVIFRSYLPGKSSSSATVVMNDSLFWDESAGSMGEMKYLIPSSEEALRELSQYTSAKAAVYFVPHWQDGKRSFYSGMGTNWKESSALALQNRWPEAQKMWMDMYQKAKGWKAQAKLSANIALSYEMQTQLEDAYEWAHRSYSLFEKNDKEQSVDRKRMTEYVQELSARLRSKQKLDSQLKGR